jgi:DNA-binding transcriptional ArsR family regulator
MRYKIYHEPMYANECIAILKNIANGASIKNEMEEALLKRGDSLRSVLETFYKTPLNIERRIKKHIRIDSDVVFLFEKWERAIAAPIDAIYFYDMLLSGGIDNKVIPIIFTITGNFPEEIWGIKDMESGKPPPNIDDGTFFRIINGTDLAEDEKMKAMKLYYDFALYCEYAHAILKECQDILHDDIKKYNSQIKSFMDSIEARIQAEGVEFLKKNFNTSLGIDLSYHIYPGVYQANTLIVNVSGLFEPYIIIGLNAFELRKTYDSTASAQEKAAQFLKILSDDTKQTILQLLKTEPLYGSQLAEKLNCTAANISHHMTALISLDVIYTIKKNNRIYFNLNKEIISKHFDAAKELFL